MVESYLPATKEFLNSHFCRARNTKFTMTSLLNIKQIESKLNKKPFWNKLHKRYLFNGKFYLMWPIFFFFFFFFVGWKFSHF